MMRLASEVDFTPLGRHRICSFALTNSHAFLNLGAVSIHLWIHGAQQFANDSRPPPLVERRVCVFVRLFVAVLKSQCQVDAGIC